MALIVQNDLGDVIGANSYATVAEYVAYWLALNVIIDISTPGLIVASEADLIRATQYFDTLNKYCGFKLNGREQTTEFPRLQLYDCSGYESVLVEGVPREVKESQFEYAYINKTNGTLQPNESTTGGIKTEKIKNKIDVIEEVTEVTYFNEGQSGSVISYPQADKKIPQDFICLSNDNFDLMVN